MKIVAAVLALITVLVGWYAIDNRGKMNTRIEELIIELEARTAYIAELTDTVQVKQFTLDSLENATKDSVLKAELRAKSYKAAGDSAKSRLERAIVKLDITEEQRSDLDLEVTLMRANYEAALDAKSESILKLTRLSQAQSEQIDRYISVNFELQIQVAAALALADEWKAEANPDFLSKLTRNPLEKVVFAVAFMGLGAAATK